MQNRLPENQDSNPKNLLKLIQDGIGGSEAVKIYQAMPKEELEVILKIINEEQRLRDQELEMEKNRQDFINERFASIPPLYQTAEFSFYKTETDQEINNLNYAMQIVNQFDRMQERGSNVIFYGTCGNGKTFLAWCIFKELTRKGKHIQYVRADNLVQDINYLRYSAPAKERKNPSEIIAKYSKSDLLIIDEIGNHADTDASRNILLSIFDERTNNKNPMICISNQNEKNLIEYLGDAGYSRIRMKGKTIPFTGRDRRISKC